MNGANIKVFPLNRLLSNDEKMVAIHSVVRKIRLSEEAYAGMLQELDRAENTGNIIKVAYKGQPVLIATYMPVQTYGQKYALPTFRWEHPDVAVSEAVVTDHMVERGFAGLLELTTKFPAG